MNENAKFVRSMFVHISRYVASPEVCLFMACQSALECDFGRSELALCVSNMFGMKPPKRRYTTSVGSYRVGVVDYARYSSVHSSVVDFIFRHIACGATNYDFSSIGAYKAFLKRSKYASDSNYLSKIYGLFNQYNFLNS